MAEPTGQPQTKVPSPLQTQNLPSTSPPLSATPSTASPSSISHKRSRSPLSIDLSNIPPLQQPAPPSNTLLITRLDDSKIFHPASLATIRAHINSIAPLNSFSPLKSMHRIICSFYDIDSSIAVRQAIDGTAFLGNSVAKCYFGEPTPIGDESQTKYLARPDAGRLFFISPPPSPPVGWEMKTEDPPNKQVHADDLATQLAKLGGRLQSSSSDHDSSSENEGEESSTKQYSAEELARLKAHTHVRGALAEHSPTTGSSSPGKKGPRSRSSTLIYDPKAHGDSPALPAVMLETEDDSDVELDAHPKKILAHTERPPLELMEH
ncbi:uncharacterized protein A1O9_05791 [Exophiala aquamarina CBS 119918]|uniref:Calcipressin n=1 Tax=Exophiala aquamarina CBS 119918 TaxID=1182545 RepID=A0A072PQU2_9EURO|nr:uncharacterized protein A1O9_05791 [Exophiala aquamarina CBS 119918]KEF57870.1 hypothetical protein A1O9_05791 [Exophiala aquamarina CBS 119918]